MQYLSKKYGVLPLGTEPNKIGYLCNEGSGSVFIKSDYLGFRNTNEQYSKKIDMIVIGDSFVHGQCVKDGETLTDNLNPYLNTLNLGTSGNHPYIYGALIKTFYPIFKPKYIVTIFCDNDKDVTDTSNYFYNFYFQKNYKSYFLKDNKINYSQNVGLYFNEYRKWLIDKNKLNEDPITPKLEIYSPQVFKLPIIRSATSDFFKKIKNYYLFLPLPTKFLIDELQRNQENFSTVHIITYIPPNEKFINDNWERYYENNIKKYAKSKKIIFIDFRKVMHAYDNPSALYQPNGIHLSKIGYELLSKVILNNLN